LTGGILLLSIHHTTPVFIATWLLAQICQVYLAAEGIIASLGWVETLRLRVLDMMVRLDQVLAGHLRLGWQPCKARRMGVGWEVPVVEERVRKMIETPEMIHMIQERAAIAMVKGRKIGTRIADDTTIAVTLKSEIVTGGAEIETETEMREIQDQDRTMPIGDGFPLEEMVVLPDLEEEVIEILTESEKDDEETMMEETEIMTEIGSMIS
jgi:hypothetical protein